MSNYFDNQTKWSWQNDGEKVIVTTEHEHPKAHTHTMDITNVSIGEMMDNPGKVMGNAHRSVPHNYKDETAKPSSNQNNHKEKDKTSMDKREAFLESLKVDQATMNKLAEVSKNHNNSSKKNTSIDSEGREIGDDGPGRLGRESGLKSGNNKVSNMRSDMKVKSNNNTPKGKLSQNGKQINNSGKALSPTVKGTTTSANNFTASNAVLNNSGGSHNGSVSGHGTTGGHGSAGGHGGTGGHGGHGGTGGHGSVGGHGGTGGHGGAGGHGGHGGTGGHGGH